MVGRVGDISCVPLHLIDGALSAMNEKELEEVEQKTKLASGKDIISETWPLWYSIFVR